MRIVATLQNAALALIAAFLICSDALARPFPARPITLVVTVSAGGTIDAVARVISQELSESLGQPVIVENRPGAGGNIAAHYVAKAPADGYTLMICSSSTVTINPHVYKTLPFHPEKSFDAVTIPATFNLILAVNPKHDASTLQGFVKVMKSQPGRLNYGSSGIGTLPHLAGELLGQKMGVKGHHVPYKGLQPAITDLLSGQIDYMFDSGSAVSHIRAGKLRALAVVGPNRFPTLPDVATFKELGVEGMEIASGWLGIFAPAGTPKPVIQRLYQEIARTVKMRDVRDKFVVAGLEPKGATPQETAAKLIDDLNQLGALIRPMNITVQ